MRIAQSIGLLAAAAGICLASAGPLHAAPTRAEDFHQVGQQGFGLRGNSYAWSMAFFRDRVYIGTNHNFLCVVRSVRGVTDDNAQQEVPVSCARNLVDMDLRGRIYAYDPHTREVELVYISPTNKLPASDGTTREVAVDLGYRSMTVFREPDGTEALYVATFSSSEVPGPPPRILRSTDGIHFHPVPGPISDDPRLASFRSLTVFKNRLYVLAIGKVGEEAILYEASDPARGDFRPVSPPFFGDPVNISAFELEVFAGNLYVGTATNTAGFQLLKTQAVGQPPYVFQKVLAEGAYRGARNQNVVSLRAFGDHLYIGTGVNYVALDFFPDVESAAAELLRVSADDDWEIVCGQTRDTPDGEKSPITGRFGGCGNSRTGYIWRMTVHDGRLYMGTFDMSLFAAFASTEGIEASIDFDLHPILAWVLEQIPAGEIADVIAALDGGFDFWSTPDGEEWSRITRTGLSDEYAYGIRSFASTPYGLFVGTANPYYGFKVFQGVDPDADFDGDSWPDVDDNCPTRWNLDQRDTDDDGVGDACDHDDDGDCIPDESDNQPLTAGPRGPDTDGDDVPDGCDADDDNDSIPDHQDNCPLVSNLDQLDRDRNGIGDACAIERDAGSGGIDDPSSGSKEPDDGNSVQRPVGGNFCGSGVPVAMLLLMGILSLGQRARLRTG